MRSVTPVAAGQTFVIVGAGLAGAKTAEALRKEHFDGRIVLIGEEGDGPYERPPLSKDYLMGRSEKDKIYVHPQRWYAEHDIDLRLRTRVTAIDRAGHRVLTDRGDPVGYDKLLLATGSSPRLLEVPGADPHRVFYLRRVEDCEQLRVTLRTASRVAVVGAGWIGLEVAAAARTAGVEVTLLETAELPLLRVLGRELAEVFADLHRDHGVDLRLGAQVVEFTGPAERATGVRVGDGTLIEADLVVVGVGATPNTGLAEAAGVAVDNGITVDEHLRSTDPDVYAAGDVANVFHPALGKHIRVEHWSNALNQPPVAARSMLGRDAVYDRAPYFFSDQYDLGMEYSGYVEPGGYDEVILRGDVGEREFLAFWVKDRVVLAGMNVNIWDLTGAVQDLVKSGRQVDLGSLADPDVPLTQVSRRPTTHRPSMRSDAIPGTRTVVVVTTPLEAELVARIAAVDDRLDVRYEPQLLPPPRIPGDHRGVDSFRRTVEQDRAWEAMLAGAEVLFGVPGDAPQGLAHAVRIGTRLRWVQATAGGAGEQVRAAGLSADEQDRVVITRAGGVHAGPLAEFAILGLLAFTKGLPRLLADQKARRWAHYPVAELAGATVLVVGLGHIGAEVARLAKAFGMRVIAVNRSGRTDSPYVDEVRTARFLGDLLPVAHGVVLALPLTEETDGMIDAAAFGRMHSGAVLVDVGHGGVVDEAALVRALEAGLLAGAALDVVATEPLPVDSPLWRLPNVLLSPHTAGRSARENERIVTVFGENLRRYLAGEELLDRIHPTLLY